MRRVTQYRVNDDDLRMLAQRKALRATESAFPVAVGWQGGALSIFVVGRPRNPLNGSRGHWSVHSRWAKGWRERTATALLGPDGYARQWIPAVPKLVTFTVYSWGKYDSDNLQAVCKPCRDALTDMRVIDDDRPSSGHDFGYANVVSRKGVTGIAIRIELR